MRKLEHYEKKPAVHLIFHLANKKIRENSRNLGKINWNLEKQQKLSRLRKITGKTTETQENNRKNSRNLGN